MQWDIELRRQHCTGWLIHRAMSSCSILSNQASELWSTAQVALVLILPLLTRAGHDFKNHGASTLKMIPVPKDYFIWDKQTDTTPQTVWVVAVWEWAHHSLHWMKEWPRWFTYKNNLEVVIYFFSMSHTKTQKGFTSLVVCAFLLDLHLINVWSMLPIQCCLSLALLARFSLGRYAIKCCWITFC